MQRVDERPRLARHIGPCRKHEPHRGREIGARDFPAGEEVHQSTLPHVIVDEPQNIAAKSAPQVWATTSSDLAIVRLHGRNEETWDIKGATAAYDRFNYDYTDEELDGLARDIEDIAKAAGEVHVIFNNNFEDQGVRNGKMMMEGLHLRRSVSG